MVYFSSKALFACVHASVLLAGSSFLPASLAKDMDAAILHHQEESLRARSVGKPNTSTAAVAVVAFAASDGNLKAADSNRSLVDVTFDNHDNGLGQDRFHLVSNFEGGSYPNEVSSASQQLHDLSMGRRVALSKDGSTAAIAGVLFDQSSGEFRWIVKVFKKDSSTGDWDTSNPIEILEEASEASLFEADAYVEIALSGDGTVIFIANVKAKRFEADTQEQGTISKYSISSSASLASSSSFDVTPDSNTAVGYYFAGLQVDVANNSDYAVVGAPYKGEVFAHNTSTQSSAVSLAFNVGADSLLGRSVAISKDGTTIAASAPGENKIHIARSNDFSTWAYEEIPGTAAGITTGNDLGSSLAINEDGTIIAIGSKNHDAEGGIDKGSVTVMIKKDGVWTPLGQTLKGERGEASFGSYYNVGDQFGTSLAISDKWQYFSGEAKNNSCPIGTVKVDTSADCFSSVSTNGSTNECFRNSDLRPSGCYVNVNVNNEVCFNTATSVNESSFPDQFRSLCKVPVIKVVVGAPKNDPDGNSGPDYYNGHVEVWEINPDETNAQFSQVAYDIDGGSSGEKSGTSVAIDSEGKSILVGSPGYEASSISGYFEGVAKMYEQTEYSAVPSDVPSSVPSVSMVPSLVPSVSMVPSVVPSVSIMPSSVPSDIPSDLPSDQPSLLPSSMPSDIPSDVPSDQPSLLPSLMPSDIPSDQPSLLPSSIPSDLPSDIPSRSPSSLPSILPSVSLSPSSLPSAVTDKEFQILSTFDRFDSTKDWCLTASEKIGESKLHVRPCRTSDSRSENLQLWKFTESGELKLAGMENGGNFCAQSIFRQVQLTAPCVSSDVTMSSFSFENGSIIQKKNNKDWKLGFDPESRFERVRLYRDGTLNEVLNKWDLRYSYEFPSKAPSPPPTMPLNLSNQVLNTDSLVGNAQGHRLGRFQAALSSDGMTAAAASYTYPNPKDYVKLYRRGTTEWEEFAEIEIIQYKPVPALSGDGKVLTISHYDEANSYRGLVMTYDIDRENGTFVKREFEMAGGAGNEFFGLEMRLSSDGSILAVVAQKYVEVYEWNSANNEWALKGTRFENLGNVPNTDSHRLYSLHMNEEGTIVGFNHAGYMLYELGEPDYREGAHQLYTWNSSDEKWERKGGFVSSDKLASGFGGYPDTGGIFNEAGDILVVAAYTYNTRTWEGSYWRDQPQESQGRVWIYKFVDDGWDLSQTIIAPRKGTYFGFETSMTKDGSILVIKDGDYGEIKVYRMNESGQYENEAGTTLTSPRKLYGYKSQIDASGNTLMVTDPQYDNNKGKVWFYEW